MSQKREKQIRRIARIQYNVLFRAWISRKPPRWRVFRYMKWKKQKPIYQRIEKELKSIVKKRG